MRIDTKDHVYDIIVERDTIKNMIDEVAIELRRIEANIFKYFTDDNEEPITWSVGNFISKGKYVFKYQTIIVPKKEEV